MVIIMESRLERHNRKKREKKDRKTRFLLILVCLLIFIGGLNLVDDSYRKLMLVNNQKLMAFARDSELYTLHLFGSDYYIEQKEVQKRVDYVKNNVSNGVDKAKGYGQHIYKGIIKLKNNIQDRF